MSVQDFMLRLDRYENRRALFWSVAVAALWCSLWLGLWYIIFQEGFVPPVEVELLAEEAYFYPIDL